MKHLVRAIDGFLDRGPRASVVSARPAPRPRILVVDDDDTLVAAAVPLLQTVGEVLVACSGARALDVVETARLDVVILELAMPDLDGWEVLGRLRATQPLLPVIVVTRLAGAEVAVDVLKRGARDYLAKPVSPGALRAAIEAALDRGSRMTPDPVGVTRPAGRAFVYSPHVGTCAILALVLRRCGVEDPVSNIDIVPALESMLGHPPSLLVVDETPASIELIRRARLLSPRCPVVILRASQPAPPRHSTSIPGPQPLTASRSMPSILEALRIMFVAYPELRARALRFPAVAVRALEEIRTRDSRSVGVTALARAVGVSRGHLSRSFRLTFGTTVSQYLSQFRLEVARHLLSQTTDKLETIADIAGFYDASHLSRMFRAHFGYRPGQFRAVQSIARGGPAARDASAGGRTARSIGGRRAIGEPPPIRRRPSPSRPAASSPWSTSAET